MPALTTTLIEEKEQTAQRLSAILACVQASWATARRLRINNDADVNDLLDSLAMSELSVLRLIGDED